MRAVEGHAHTDILAAADRLEAILGEPWPLVPDALDAERRRVLTLTTTALRPLAEGAAGPIVAVLAGSTGVGKSTLLNGFAGHRVSDASALRPTTGRPVAWCHPRHADGFRARTFGGVTPEVVVDERAELRNLVVVDAPDFDTVAEGHRAMADALLVAADVVVFVSSPARFGDLAAWNRVVDGLRRDVPMLHVLNRSDAATVAAVRSTVPDRARSRGLILDPDEFIPVAEQPLDPDTLGPPRSSVHHILSLLVEIADEDADHARAFALEGARRRVSSGASALRSALLDAAPRVDAALAGIEAVVEAPFEPALPTAAIRRHRRSSLAQRLRGATQPIPESLVAVVEDRLRVEVDAADLSMRGAWTEHLPLPPSVAAVDPEQVTRSAWASWVREVEDGPGVAEVADRPWRATMRVARETLAAPYRDAAARSIPDLDALHEAVGLLGGVA